MRTTHALLPWPWLNRRGRNKHWGKARDAGKYFVQSGYAVALRPRMRRRCCNRRAFFDRKLNPFRFSLVLLTEDFDTLDKHRLGTSRARRAGRDLGSPWWVCSTATTSTSGLWLRDSSLTARESEPTSQVQRLGAVLYDQA